MTHIHRRSFLRHSAAVGAALIALPVLGRSINERLNLGFIGLGGRGNELLGQFTKLPDVRIAALCDPDSERLSATAEKHPDAAKYADLRQLLDDRNIDAVVIATCNHWHALAAIWACQAGKDVYVEKPLAHNHWEGQQLVHAARKHNRIVQVGTQQRSDPLQAELKDFLHDQKILGAIECVQVCRFGRREPIGKRKSPLETPATLNYNLWLGPARDEPIYRDNLHYDWHWDWNTGNGEMGNWGVHVLDDAVNVVLLDEVPFPKRIAAAGGRCAWNDAGQTPNACFVYYDTGSTPIFYGMSNLPDGAGKNKVLDFEGVGSGYVIHCEGGYYAGGRGGGTARDKNGKRIRRFKGDAGAKHPRNFVDAVTARNPGLLNAEVQIGHQSSAWCNLANVATQAAEANSASSYNPDTARAIGHGLAPWSKLVETMEQHLAKNSVDPSTEFTLSPILDFDGVQEQFVGDQAEVANRFLQREYSREFKVPTIT